jgi:Type II CAAX prenyl endopeptidase Rce1-like
VWGARLGGFPNHEFMDLLVQRMGLRASPIVSTMVYILLAGSFGLVKSLASALGEEIGWRGFLVPELFKNIGFTGTALISGVVWACWHYPLLIWSDAAVGVGCDAAGRRGRRTFHADLCSRNREPLFVRHGALNGRGCLRTQNMRDGE